LKGDKKKYKRSWKKEEMKNNLKRRNEGIKKKKKRTALKKIKISVMNPNSNSFFDI